MRREPILKSVAETAAEDVAAHLTVFAVDMMLMRMEVHPAIRILSKDVDQEMFGGKEIEPSVDKTADVAMIDFSIDKRRVVVHMHINIARPKGEVILGFARHHGNSAES